jgi:deoxycytidylate deaminase
MNINKFIDLAYKQSEKSGHKHFKHGCVIVKDNQIVSRGYNDKRIEPKLRKYGYTYLYHHSESYAVIKAERINLENSTAFVVRKTPTKLGNSKPCICCVSLMREAGVKDVFYSNSKGQIEYMSIER